MGTPTIDQSFVSQFEEEVKLDYQRMGSKLMSMVRLKTNVVGKDTTFQRFGTGEMGTKSRHGQVPLADFGHQPVLCSLNDFYLGEFIDKLDELKIEHDERAAVTQSLAAAAGRKSDSLITTQLATTTNDTADAGGVTLPKIEEVFEFFGNNDVPDDGQRFLAVSPQGWTDLLNLDQFANADYVSPQEAKLPFNNVAVTMKKWFSFMVFMFSGLPKTGAIRQSFAWHRSAVGHASGADVNIDPTWQGKEQAWLFVASISQGSVLIDDTGVYRVDHTEV